MCSMVGYGITRSPTTYKKEMVYMALSDALRAAKAKYDEHEARRKAEAAERARLDAIAEGHRRARIAKAREAKAEVMELIRMYNSEHGVYDKIELVEDLPPVPTAPKCGTWTVFADCRDTNCSRHYYEKKTAGQATQGSAPTVEDPFGLNAVLNSFWETK